MATDATRLTASRRLSPLPRGWAKIRRRVLERDDYICQLRMAGCTTVATDVDHISDRDDHSLDNLRAACSSCHDRRTYIQTLYRAPRRRAPERHPGLKE